MHREFIRFRIGLSLLPVKSLNQTLSCASTWCRHVRRLGRLESVVTPVLDRGAIVPSMVSMNQTALGVARHSVGDAHRLPAYCCHAPFEDRYLSGTVCLGFESLRLRVKRRNSSGQDMDDITG
jgi:hypothetical protein